MGALQEDTPMVSENGKQNTEEIYPKDVVVINHCAANYHNLSDLKTTSLLSLAIVCIRTLGWAQLADSPNPHAIDGGSQQEDVLV